MACTPFFRNEKALPLKKATLLIIYVSAVMSRRLSARRRSASR